MKLFIMRHGEAEAHAATDAQRRLTERGRVETSALLERYQEVLGDISELWASPYIRAQQTAEIVTQHVPSLAQSHTSPLLVPDGNLRVLLKALEEAMHTDPTRQIILVSHQPLVGTLVDSLAGLEPGAYRMGTSALACLEFDFLAPGCSNLMWLHQPN
ncbi:phosphohistidine phosphatase SixA [Marinibactrum halimedae]|nr:phosphohistidine phosphatase SixA [Marinibactrum halimedae]MCD9458699.1 phosphohistidine phosphatase SixA [Marinibactrum halimedae]